MVEANIVDSCTEFNEFAPPWLGRGRGMDIDDRYNVFNDFAFAKEGA